METIEQIQIEKTSKKAFKELESLANDLRYKLNNIKMTRLWDNYWQENKQEEKGHRVFCPDHITPPLSVHKSATLFSVHQIVKYTIGLESYIPSIDDYLHVRKSCYTALALAINYADEIIDCLEGYDIESIMKLDYAEIMQEGLN